MLKECVLHLNLWRFEEVEFYVGIFSFNREKNVKNKFLLQKICKGLFHFLMWLVGNCKNLNNETGISQMNILINSDF